jgi:hypothetical protein
MRPLAVVVVDIHAQDAFEVAAVEDQQPVEALSTHGADKALGNRARFRGPGSGCVGPDPFAAEVFLNGPGYWLSPSRIRTRICCSAKERPRLRACSETAHRSGSPSVERFQRTYLSDPTKVESGLDAGFSACARGAERGAEVRGKRGRRRSSGSSAP